MMTLCVCTGKVVHSMVAHLDAVTCLTTDPKGTYLISGSEYTILSIIDTFLFSVYKWEFVSGIYRGYICFKK